MEMEVLYFIPSQNFENVKNALLKDDEINRQSIVFRDATHFGKKDAGTYVKLSGLDATIEKAKTLVGEQGRLVEGKEKDDVLAQIRMEEDAAAQGFGSIFE